MTLNRAAELSLHELVLDELFALPLEERQPYLEQAAKAVEGEYLTNPDLTATIDILDLYNYPMSE